MDSPKVTKQDMQKVNKRLSKTSKFLEPIEFKEPMDPISHEMAFGLAQIYAVRGFREYMINEYHRTIKASALNSESISEVLYYKARAMVMKELLTASKKAFENMDRLSTRAKNTRSQNVATS